MTAKTFEEWARFMHDTYERLAPSFGYTTRLGTRVFDPESDNGRLMIATVTELLTTSRAALLADRPKVARVLSRLRDVDAPICDSGADTIESLAAQLAELEAELAKVKALIDSHNEECRNLCDAAREKNACGYANYYPKKNCPTCSEDWIIAYPKDAQ